MLSIGLLCGMNPSSTIYMYINLTQILVSRILLNRKLVHIHGHMHCIFLKGPTAPLSNIVARQKGFGLVIWFGDILMCTYLIYYLHNYVQVL